MTILFGELTLIASFGRARFVDLQLPNAAYGWFGGPQFGAEKLKKRFGVEDWPLLFAIIKPSIGKESNSAKVKEKIECVLNSGFHAIKDDEMQGNLRYAPLKERLKFAKKYGKCVPVLNLDNIIEYKKFVEDEEAKKIGMIMVNASTIGFPQLHEIRKISKVPICSHLAMQGAYHCTFSPKMFAAIHRLFGADAYITPLGETKYFGVSKAVEKEMVIEFTKEQPIKKTLPLLAGGARLQNLGKIMKPYEKMNTPYGIGFGALIFASDEEPGGMCKKVVEKVKEFKRGN